MRVKTGCRASYIATRNFHFEPQKQLLVIKARFFNQTSVGKFFEILSSLRNGYYFSPHGIFNVDEIGITTMQTKPTRIIGLRGKKQVGTLTPGKRRILATAVCCMYASGQFGLPFLIFPKVACIGICMSLFRVDATFYFY